MDFTNFVSQLEDSRRSQGLRYPFKSMLIMVLLGVCCGHNGYRSLSRFMKANAGFFSKELNLPHGVPSHVTISTILKSLNKDKTIEVFNNWTKHEKILKANDRVSLDGKALRSTVKNDQTSAQDFINVVSIYAKELGLVAFMQEYRNKKSNEIHLVQEMLAYLKGLGVVILLDALHCQKKQ